MSTPIDSRLNMSDIIILILFAGYIFHQMDDHTFWVRFSVVAGIKIIVIIIQAIVAVYSKVKASHVARNPR